MIAISKNTNHLFNQCQPVAKKETSLNHRKHVLLFFLNINIAMKDTNKHHIWIRIQQGYIDLYQNSYTIAIQ